MIQPPAKGPSNQFVINAVEFLTACRFQFPLKTNMLYSKGSKVHLNLSAHLKVYQERLEYIFYKFHCKKQKIPIKDRLEA